MEDHTIEESFNKHSTVSFENTLPNLSQYGEDQGEIPDKESVKISKLLTSIGELANSEILRLSNLNQAGLKEEIDSLKKEVRMYLFLIAMIAINSAWYYYIINLIIYYDKDELEISGPANAKLASLVALPFSLKPIWGCLSDSFYLFGYR